MPRYMPTQFDELENKRQSMLISLTGQFTVVLFRFMTGHWSSAIIGLVVFAVGNRARCSLQNTSLTSFVILGFGTGALDSVDLLHNIVSNGTGFFVFPLEMNLLQDLFAISLMLAPMAEVSGARLAWDSFLNPELLLRAPQTPAVQYHQQASMWGQVVPAHPVQHYSPQQQGSWQWQGPMHPQASQGWQSTSTKQPTSWSHAAYRALFGSSAVEPAHGEDGDDLDDAHSMASSSMYSPTRRQAQRRRNYSTGSDSVQGRKLGPLSSTEPVNDLLAEFDGVDQQCSQCGDNIPAHESRDMFGSGEFADTAFCRTCWNAWSA